MPRYLSSYADRLPLPGVSRPEETLLEGVRRVTWVGLACNIVLTIVKAAIGFAAASQALMADAAHSLSDLATDIIVLAGVRYWAAPADAGHPHGHRKMETLVTLAIGMAVGVVGVGIGYAALVSLHGLPPGAEAGSPEGASRPAGDGVRIAAALAALLSVVAKEWLYRWTVREGRRLKSSAVIANGWHHRTDALSSAPVLVAIISSLIAGRLGYSLDFLDPVAAVVVAAMIAHAAFVIIKGAASTLLDAGAAKSQTMRMMLLALETPGVSGVHALRTRWLGQGSLAVDMHILVDNNITLQQAHEIASHVEERLERGMDEVVEVMVHLEPAEGAH